MTQTRELLEKMADFFKSEEFYEKGEDARLELSPDDVRCMNKIIKACNNAISRQAVLSYIYNDLGLGDEENGGDIERQKELESSYRYVKSLPPVISQPKTGHWEYVQYDYNPKLGNWHCSECRCVAVECVNKEEKGGIPLYKYCPQCGTKMIELQAESNKCHNCKHYTSGQRDGSCGSYICKHYSGWESEG